MRTLTIPSEPFRLPEKLAKIHAGLVGEAEELNAALQKFDEEAEQLRSKPPDELTDKDLAALRSQTQRAVELIRQEIALRKRIAAEYYPPRSTARSKAYNLALENKEKLRQKISEGLAAIGFNNEASPIEYCRIIPEFFNRHPGFTAATQEIRRLGGLKDDTQDEQTNKAEIAILEERMRGYIARLKA